ncbi:MAG: extracellular solute-binding protein [FCB group bacterium]|jgi:raffinose/stachyose/melibiose transport system substrate-binding protein|nr:extracellular solute-binding protein [FCB group bacterium]
MSFRKIIRWASLAAVVVLGTWLLWPPRDEAAEAQSEARQGESAKYTIRIFPGYFMMPDTMPMGVGKPIHAARDVIREFERLNPDTKVEIINMPATREYLVTQLSSGRAPDIVTVNVEDVWTDVQKGWYLALDPYLEAPNPYVVAKGDPNAPGYEQWWDMFRYQAISRGKAAPDKLMYCLSYDMIETGFYYNKDIFKKMGFGVPKDWDEFIEDCKKLKEAGYTPIAANIDIISDWCTDLFFDQIYNDLLPGIDLVRDPLREPYLQGYLDWDEIYFLHQKGFFTPEDLRYRELWRLMKDFRQYCGANFSRSADDIMREFITQNAAMVWMHSQFTYRLGADKNLGFEWGVFYPPSFTEKTTPYASNVPMCVIGGSANQFEVTNAAYSDTGDPKTSVRLKRVLGLLQFMCLPENADRITNEYPCMISNIVGVPVLPELKPFEEILERPYTTTKWIFTFDLRYAEIYRRTLELYMNDGIDLEGFLVWQEENMDTATANLLKRKALDLEPLQAVWDQQAPQRATMKDLPNVQ